MPNKFLLASKGVNGSLMVILGFVLQMLPVMGVQLSISAQEIIDPISKMLEGVGGIYALVGRITADTKVSWKTK